MNKFIEICLLAGIYSLSGCTVKPVQVPQSIEAKPPLLVIPVAPPTSTEEKK